MVEDIIHLGLIDEGDLELDAAALEIAALDHPDADLAGYLDRLDDMADRLHARGGAAPEAARQAEILAEVLAGEFGFEGDRETYDDPANADLICVMDRRRGLPIALAIIYVALSRRLGWSADALNTPGHVLVGVGAPRSVVIDPFSRGDIVRPQQLVGFLRAALGRMATASPEHVAPMSNRAVLVRLLMNQATRAERGECYPRALLVWRRITTVAPAYSFGWWELARLERSAGELAAARGSLSSMLETTRDPALRTQVMSALDGLGG